MLAQLAGLLESVQAAAREAVVYDEQGQGWAQEPASGRVREVHRDLVRSQLLVTQAAIDAQVALTNGQVQVETDPGALTAHDVETGQELWSHPLEVEHYPQVWMGDDVVLVVQEAPALLMHEWFAPSDERANSLELLDARTGEILERTRYVEGSPATRRRPGLPAARDHAGPARR